MNTFDSLANSARFWLSVALMTLTAALVLVVPAYNDARTEVAGWKQALQDERSMQKLDCFEARKAGYEAGKRDSMATMIDLEAITATRPEVATKGEPPIARLSKEYENPRLEGKAVPMIEYKDQEAEFWIKPGDVFFMGLNKGEKKGDKEEWRLSVTSNGGATRVLTFPTREKALEIVKKILATVK